MIPNKNTFCIAPWYSLYLNSDKKLAPCCKFKETVEDILGGVRSACTYIGARRLKDMPKCATFVTTYNVINKVYDQYTEKN